VRVQKGARACSLKSGYRENPVVMSMWFLLDQRRLRYLRFHFVLYVWFYMILVQGHCVFHHYSLESMIGQTSPNTPHELGAHAVFHVVRSCVRQLTWETRQQMRNILSYESFLWATLGGHPCRILLNTAGGPFGRTCLWRHEVSCLMQTMSHVETYASV
jgi:hypothetical protein